MGDETRRDRIERWVDLSASARDVWPAIGGFGALAAWHPSVASCEEAEIDGETHRHIKTGDGAYILEKLLQTGESWYRYTIIEGPLPVSGYRSTLSCHDREEGRCRVFWSSTFEPEDPAADDIVGGLYETGLEALRAKYGGA